MPCGWLVGRKIPRAGKYNQLFFFSFLVAYHMCVCFSGLLFPFFSGKKISILFLICCCWMVMVMVMVGGGKKETEGTRGDVFLVLEDDYWQMRWPPFSFLRLRLLLCLALCLCWKLKIWNPCRVFVLSIWANKQTTASRLAGGFFPRRHTLIWPRDKHPKQNQNQKEEKQKYSKDMERETDPPSWSTRKTLRFGLFNVF